MRAWMTATTGPDACQRSSGRRPAFAHMLEGAQAIHRIGAPFPVGQFGRHRLLEALAVGGQAFKRMRAITGAISSGSQQWPV